MPASPHHVPEHHPPAEDLLAYVTGATDPWLETLVACHLTLCPHCRAEVETLDTLGGLLLADRSASDAEDGGNGRPMPRPRSPALASPMADVRGGLGERPPPDLSLPPELRAVVPRPLHPHLRDARPRFRFSVPGVKQIALTLTGGGRPVQLVRFAPGYTVPEHGHAGLEWLLILSGYLRDGATGEFFRRGDVSVRDTEHVHTQHIGEEEACIAVFATLGPPLPHTFLGKLLARAVGL